MPSPQINKAAVDRGKIVDYLLNPTHPDNGGKAGFFMQLGFDCEQWELLAGALKTMVAESEVVSATESPHGRKYVAIGKLQSPTGKSALVKSIWIVDKNQDTARLVTAYPHKDKVV